MRELITPKYEKIKKDEYEGNYDIIDKISFGDGRVYLRETRETGMDLYKANKGDLITSKINVHQGAMALSPDDIVCSTHYQIYAVNETETNPKYLLLVLRSAKFLDIVNSQKAGGIKNEAGAEFLSQFKIPLPPLDVQNEIVAIIEKQKQIVEGAENIENGYHLEISIPENVSLTPIGGAVIDTKNGWSPVCNGGETKVLALSCLRNGAIDTNETKYTSESRDDLERFYIKDGDFFYSRGNTKELVALSGIAKNVWENIVFPDLLTRVQFDEEKIIPQYAVYLFNSNIGRSYFGVVPEGGTPNMIKVSQEYMKDFKVPYAGQLDIQRQIVEKLDQQMRALEGVRLLRSEAGKRIQDILAEVWGEK